MEYRTKEKSYPDLFDVLGSLSKVSSWFFWALVKERNSINNYTMFKSTGASESRKISRAYKELYALGLIKRVQQQKYIINPKVMIPRKNNYQDVLCEWNNL